MLLNTFHTPNSIAKKSTRINCFSSRLSTNEKIFNRKSALQFIDLWWPCQILFVFTPPYYPLTMWSELLFWMHGNALLFSSSLYTRFYTERQHDLCKFLFVENGRVGIPYTLEFWNGSSSFHKLFAFGALLCLASISFCVYDRWEAFMDAILENLLPGWEFL